eukprot:GHVN01016980.1.p1 GENE.GHVN01016980.1~~GHVN01016980.1.p1  ORF type:complete len:546 (+),score=76.93 GHVN01016980.1:81-1718(+)
MFARGGVKGVVAECKVVVAEGDVFRNQNWRSFSCSYPASPYLKRNNVDFVDFKTSFKDNAHTTVGMRQRPSVTELSKHTWRDLPQPENPTTANSHTFDPFTEDSPPNSPFAAYYTTSLDPSTPIMNGKPCVTPTLLPRNQAVRAAASAWSWVCSAPLTETTQPPLSSSSAPPATVNQPHDIVISPRPPPVDQRQTPHHWNDSHFDADLVSLTGVSVETSVGSVSTDSSQGAAPAPIIIQRDVNMKPFTPPTSLELSVTRPEITRLPPTLYTGPLLRELATRHIEHSGRNSRGWITSRHRGGGVRRDMIFIDYKRGRKDIWATVLRLEQNPGRDSWLALIQYDDGVVSYIFAAKDLSPGDRVIASADASVHTGNCLPLAKIPAGTLIHNLEIRPGEGGKMVRAPGSKAKVLKSTIYKGREVICVECPSTEIRRFSPDVWATVGVMSGNKPRLWKAGDNRRRGKRPRVKGTAMSPNDHPHGGSSRRGACKSLWGRPAHNCPTRARGKPNDHLVRKRVPASSQKPKKILSMLSRNKYKSLIRTMYPRR